MNAVTQRKIEIRVKTAKVMHLACECVEWAKAEPLMIQMSSIDGAVDGMMDFGGSKWLSVVRLSRGLKAEFAKY